MMRITYKGQYEHNGEWVESDNIIFDSKKGAYYLIPELFSKGKLNCASRSALHQYKVKPNTLGVNVAQDSYGKKLFLGDKVNIVYYNKNDLTKKLQATCKLVYDETYKIVYMKSIATNTTFLFNGDAYHIVTKIQKEEDC